jgi:hypothetical protein
VTYNRWLACVRYTKHYALAKLGRDPYGMRPGFRKGLRLHWTHKP